MSYEELRNLPIRNGVTIIGDKEFEDYGFVPITPELVDELMLEVFGYLL